MRRSPPWLRFSLLGVGLLALSCGGAKTGLAPGDGIDAAPGIDATPNGAAGDATGGGAGIGGGGGAAGAGGAGVDAGTPDADACTIPGAQPCPGGFACAGGACKSRCDTDDDCRPSYFCQAQTCHVGAVRVAAGYSHSCALLADGSVRCWGDNNSGELGTGSAGNPPPSAVRSPVTVDGLTGATAIAAGGFDTCTVLASGSASCWGRGTSSRATAIGVAGVAAVAAGYQVCAVVTDGAVMCWSDAAPTPVPVPGLTGVEQVSVGGDHACGLLRDRSVVCWGANDLGQLGDGTMSATAWPVPVKVIALTTAKAIAAGGTHTCALLEDGGGVCWGDNRRGQLGDGTKTSSAVPVPVSGLTGARALAASTTYKHTCALLAGGSVVCWGDGAAGRLGNGKDAASFDMSDSPIPVLVTGLTGATDIALGDGHACVTRANGSVWCWGYGGEGQLGDPASTVRTFSAIPVQVLGW